MTCLFAVCDARTAGIAAACRDRWQQTRRCRERWWRWYQVPPLPIPGTTTGYTIISLLLSLLGDSQVAGGCASHGTGCMSFCGSPSASNTHCPLAQGTTFSTRQANNASSPLICWHHWPHAQLLRLPPHASGWCLGKCATLTILGSTPFQNSV